MKATIETWWFAGLLIGMTQIANDDTFAPAIRRVARDTLADLENYAFDDNLARRVCGECGTLTCTHLTVQ